MPMASQTTEGRQRPPRPSVPAFGGWEGGAGAPPDYSLDFTKIRAARMQRRRKALSWSSFVGNAANAAEAPGGGGEEEEERQHQWSSATSDGDDDRERRRRRRHGHRHRRLRSDPADDRVPIQPRRAAPKERGKFKGYLFGCVGGLW